MTIYIIAKDLEDATNYALSKYLPREVWQYVSGIPMLLSLEKGARLAYTDNWRNSRNADAIKNVIEILEIKNKSKFKIFINRALFFWRKQ